MSSDEAAGPPRVLLATPDYLPDTGGIQNYLGGLVSCVASPVRVVALKPRMGNALTQKGSAKPHTEMGVIRVARIRWIGRAGWMAHLNVVTVLELLRSRPNVFISGHILLGPASLVCRLLGIPVIAFVYADEVAEKPRLASWSLRAATVVVAISKHSATVARSVGVPASRLRIIHPGVDVPPAKVRRKARAAALLIVSRLVDSYKGHDMLLNALAVLQHRLPGIELGIVGEGPLRPELERLAAQLGLQDRVEFHGAVTASELEELYRLSDAFVMPSRLSARGGGEGFGIVFLEASAHGLPVIAGNEGGALDAVVDGETGLLVDPRSPQAIAQAIETVLTDKDLYHALSSGGLAWARAHDWRALGQQYDAVLEEVSRR